MDCRQSIDYESTILDKQGLYKGVYKVATNLIYFPTLPFFNLMAFPFLFSSLSLPFSLLLQFHSHLPFPSPSLLPHLIFSPSSMILFPPPGEWGGGNFLHSFPRQCCMMYQIYIFVNFTNKYDDLRRVSSFIINFLGRKIEKNLYTPEVFFSRETFIIQK